MFLGLNKTWDNRQHKISKSYLSLNHRSTFCPINDKLSKDKNTQFNNYVLSLYIILYIKKYIILIYNIYNILSYNNILFYLYICVKNVIYIVKYI